MATDNKFAIEVGDKRIPFDDIYYIQIKKYTICIQAATMCVECPLTNVTWTGRYNGITYPWMDGSLDALKATGVTVIVT